MISYLRYYLLFLLFVSKFLQQRIIFFGDLKKHHKQTKEKSLNVFNFSPRIKDVEEEEAFYSNKLEKHIDEIYSDSKKVTKKKTVRIVIKGAAAIIPTITGIAIGIVFGSPIIALSGIAVGSVFGFSI